MAGQAVVDGHVAARGAYKTTKDVANRDKQASGKQLLRRRRWTDDEREKLLRVVGGHITKKTMLSGREIIALARILPGRSVAQIRAQVNNYITGKVRL